VFEAPVFSLRARHRLATSRSAVPAATYPADAKLASLGAASSNPIEGDAAS
jgi:hypothetical protein